MSLRLNDWFCGAGGATQGAHAVPGILPILAANHDKLAIDTHSTNFPDVEHFRGDIKDLDVAKHPYAEIFWASPECTNWSRAKGNPADYATEPGLFGDPDIADDVQRSRALMQDVIRYLEGMILRQQPVLAGIVENVTDIRRWTLWGAWRSRIEGLGYRTRLIALNSMHANARVTPRAPQSRDRLYLAYWHESLGRDPDWDKWLRPTAWCESCGEDVTAIQAWKQPGRDMGRYGQQYVYRCPKVSCRGAKVEPYFLPALAAIDWTLPGERIGDRDKPLADKTRARIAAGIARYWGPLHLEAAGNTYDAADPKHAQYGQPGAYYRAWPTSEPLRSLHTTMSKALAVPVEGRDGKVAQPIDYPMRTQTARNETGVAFPPLVTRHYGVVGGHPARHSKPATDALRTLTCTGGNMSLLQAPFVTQFRDRTDRNLDPASAPLNTIVADGANHAVVAPFVAELRGGGSTARPAADPLATVTASGNHHALVSPYFGNSDTSKPAEEALGTLTTRDRYALVMRNNGTQGNLAWASTPVTEQLRSITTKGQQAILTPGDLEAAMLRVDDCLFRMFEPHEIHAGMAFVSSYVVLGNKRQKVKQLGNAVTPPVAEVLVSALVECIQGHDLAGAA